MNDLPTGTVTFLMTDVEGSTRKWAEDPERMRASLERHDRLAQRVCDRHHGTLVKQRGEGDSLFMVFRRCQDAALAATELHQGLREDGEEGMLRLSVRAAIHVGETQLRDEDYYGPVINRCARLRGIGHAGQTLVSEAVAQILRDEPPTGLILRDLGFHRLKDLLRAERVYSLQKETEAKDFPPLRSLNTQVGALPVQLTSLIGREKEVADILGLIESHRLVTLTGSGGAGKTRLALQAAVEAAESHPDGLFFIDLVPVAPNEPMPEVIVRSLKISVEPGQDAVRALQTMFGGSSPLLVLDNCEHVIEDAAETCEDLLTSCPGLRILATSRESLRLPGEATYLVPPLRFPSVPCRLPPDEILGYEAVALFCERAALRSHGFALDGNNAEAVAEICWLLDGIPLAIEQAASNVGFLTPGQILEGLREGLNSLRATSRGGERRHKTLELTNEWSFSLLAEEERALFARLGVFAGGWTLSAAGEVCAGDDIRAGAVPGLLGGLVAKSLVTANDEGRGDKRYRYLHAVREFALKKLGSEDAPVRARHFAWCLAVARRAEPEFLGKDQTAWLERFDRDYSNLRQALDWGLRTRHGGLLDLVFLLRYFWLFRSDLAEGRHWVERALEAVPGAPARLRAQSLNLLGALIYKQNLPELAKLHHQHSLALWKTLEDPGGEADVHNNLGLVAMHQGNVAEGREHFRTSLSIYESLEQPGKSAQSALNVALCEEELGNYAEAMTLIEQALRLVRRQGGNPWLEAGATLCLANVARQLGSQRECLQHLEAALILQRELRNKLAIFAALTLLAEQAHEKGKNFQSAWLLGAADGLREASGHAPKGTHWKIQQEVSQAVAEVLSTAEIERQQALGRAAPIEVVMENSLELLRTLTLVGTKSSIAGRNGSPVILL